MSFRRAVLAAFVLAVAAACGGNTGTVEVSRCARDTDCKGARICVNGQCVDNTADAGKADSGSADSGAADAGATDAGADGGPADAGCTPESDAALCTANNAACGSITATDNCGASRTVADCGACNGTDTCGGGGTANQCGCTAATTCPGGQNCGTAADGCGGTINCGTCSGFDTCGGGGTTNVCGCTAATTCPGGQNCGTAADACGGTINCGTCSGFDTCGGGGTANQCGCTPLTAAQICANASVTCGPFTGSDGCGNSTTVTCDFCPGGHECTASNTCSTCWVASTPMPSPVGGEAVVSVSGKLYELEGFGSGGGSTNAASVYDPSAQAWTALPNAPTSRAYPSAAVIGSKIYVTGGCVGSDCRVGVTGALDVFDTVAGTWSSGPAMPTGRFQAMIGAVNGELYVAGGTTACPPCAPSSAVEAYDPVANAWTSLAPLASPLSAAGSAVVGSELITFGGYNGSSYVANANAFDPSVPSWTALAPLPAAGGSMGGVGVNGTAWSISGQGSGGTTVGTVTSYDPGANAWSSIEDLPTPRYQAGAATINGSVYVAGSLSGNTPTTKVEQYTCCIPESDAQFCSSNGATCGSLTATDNCGAGRTANCGACAPLTVTGGLDAPGSLAARGSTLYFSVGLPPSVTDCYSATGSGDAVKFVPSDGSAAPTKIADVDHYAGNCGVGGLVTDATNVYWIDYADGVIAKALLNGTGVTTLRGGVNQYGAGLAVDTTSTNLYWYWYANGSIGQVPLPGGGSSTQFTATQGTWYGVGMAVDANFLYWTDHPNSANPVGVVNKVALASPPLTAPTQLASSQYSPGYPVVSGATLYWLNGASSATNDGALMQVPLAGGAATSVATGLVNPGELAADSSNAYVASWGTAANNFADGRIYRISLSTGAVTVLASGLQQPTSIAVDGTYVYWTDNNTTTGSTRNSDGAILRLPK